MFLHYLVRVLETVFFVGMAGSLVVAIWAFVGDIHVLFDRDKPAGSQVSVEEHAPSFSEARQHPAK